MQYRTAARSPVAYCVPGRVALKREPLAPLAPISCPYCAGPLKWSPDRWLGVFECGHCGRFSDFQSASAARYILVPAQPTDSGQDPHD